jgi:hypothetical protein
MKKIVLVISICSAFILILLFVFSETLTLSKSKSTEYPNDTGETTSDTSALRDTSLWAIDSILSKLQFANIAFEIPRTMDISERKTLKLLLSVKMPMDKLKRQLDSTGELEGKRIRYSELMEAKLSGRHFNIISITPDTQLISKDEVNEWKWEIEPKEQGKQSLHLSIFALLTVNGNHTIKPIRTFDYVIAVNVTRAQKISSFIEENWQWIFTAILIPFIVWLWKSLIGKKQHSKHKSKKIK